MSELDLPKGWLWKNIFQVAKIYGKSIFPSEDVTYNYIGLENIDSHTLKLVNFQPQLGKEIKSNKVEFKTGMVLYGKLRPYLNKVLVADFDGIATTEILPFLCFENEIHSKYLAYFLASPSFLSKVTESSQGTRMPRLRTDFWEKEANIPIPPISTQQKIVSKIEAAFTLLDQAIARQRQNIQRIEDLKKTVLEEVFSCSEWNPKRIEEIAFIKGGKRLPQGMSLLSEKTVYPYIRVADFGKNGTVNVEKLKYLDAKAQKSIKNYTITSNDLYISIAGTIGLTGIIPKELDGANLTENAAKLVYKEPSAIENKFIYYFSISRYFTEQASDATKTVAQPKLALTRLAQIEIPMPETIKEQRKIVTQLDNIFTKADALLAAQQARLSHLEELKKSILAEAFQGQL